MKNHSEKLRVSLGRGLFALLLGCFSYQTIASDDGYECNFSWVTDHPTEKCANLFAQKLASLSQEEIARYEKEYQQLKVKTDIFSYNDLLYLTSFYPKPEALFVTFQWEEKLYKDQFANSDEKFSYNGVTGNYTEYPQKKMGYQILAKMLENQTSLSDSEKKMLTVSKHRAACIDEVQQYFQDNPDLPISVHYISDKCYF